MYRIILVNMPFADVNRPSLALTQLKARLVSGFQDRVEVEIVNLNHDFARALGLTLYGYIAGSMDSHNAGLGDWLFRQLAFLELADNTEKYFRRYFPARARETEALKADLLAGRRELASLMESSITRYSMDQADLVGFTSMFMQNAASFTMARMLKARNPKIITVMGGANCEPPMGLEIIKNVESIDYVFSGPALKNFPDFVGHCLNQETEQYLNLAGIYTREKASSPASQGAIGEELSIDVPIALNYESFLQEYYDKFGDSDVELTLPFETSRGCWWGERSHCTFCGLNGMTMEYRAMAPDRALEQFKALFQYSDRASRFEAVDNILPRNYLREVLPLIETPPNAQLFYEVKADLSEQDLITLAKSRVKRIQPGIESLATSTLKLMKKGATVFQNLYLLKNCALYGIEPAWNLLIGFPGEGEDVYRKYVDDLPLLKHLPPPAGVFPVRFDRYSPYFVKAGEYGLDLRPLDFYKLIYPFPEESLARFAYYFADSNYSAQYFTEMLRWINKLKEQVAAWAMSWRDSSPEAHPKLFFKELGVGYVIYDSRSGEVVEHPIDEIGWRILQLASKPKRLEDLCRELGQFSPAEVERELALLQKKRCIFQEGERYFNLVLPRDPHM